MLPPSMIAIAQILVASVSLLFLRPAVQTRNTPGSKSFIVLICAFALWGYLLAIGNLTGYRALSKVAYQAFLGTVLGATIAWFLLAIEVSERRTVSSTLLWLVAAIFLVAQLAVWTDPWH